MGVRDVPIFSRGYYHITVMFVFEVISSALISLGIGFEGVIYIVLRGTF
jgi:hypothetical protein